MTQKNHWETIFSTKKANEVSWTQVVPQTSLDFIHISSISKSDAIIDIGGGASNLVDFLLLDGYTNVTVLDISATALETAKLRLGTKANQVTWIEADITTFLPTQKYKVWHDRAAFHFLTTTEQIEKYLSIARKAIDDYLIIGTFSENGPEKCSGLEIKQYSKTDLQETFKNGFKKIKCINEDHRTPFNTIQNFTFCSFKLDN